MVTRLLTRLHHEESGFHTAELIGAAAVGILILVAALGPLRTLAGSLAGWMQAQLGM